LQISNPVLNKIKFVYSKINFSLNVVYINGEACVKYVTKYVTKGSDLGWINVFSEKKDTDGTVYDFDEFNFIKMARFITAFEAYMGILGQPIVWTSHKVNI
jgi:hypothetical protein